MSKGNSSPGTPAAESTESNDISMKKATRSKCLRTTPKETNNQKSQKQEEEVLIISDEENEERSTKPEDGSTSH